MTPEEVKAYIDKRIDQQFEDRVAYAMEKAMDIVISDVEIRLTTLETDMASVLRHLGLS